MRLEVRLFAAARQHAGAPTIAVELPDAATVADLRRALAREIPEIAPWGPRLMIAVNSEYADDALAIPPGAEVAAIPP